MPNLVDEAEAEYARIGEGRHVSVPVTLRTDEFDFFTSQEISAVPIHMIEARRGQQCYSGTADRGAALCDFIKAIGFLDSFIEDPANGRNILRVDEAMRAYFGEQEGEAYRLFRKNIIPCAEDVEWLKRTTFLDNETADECERQRCVDRSTRKGWCRGVTKPCTTYKQAFFAKQCKKATL
ncbi:hypothetical protein LSCM4_02854 [Leishmania orientalis]|uniref:Uncharacterized protein n=1 Tax=Leishmania orientalis TaxID=2249476 RepID=A0A836GQW8_9TRYP|nr:hypothetical protein LSCM4_02854 [Leishmania orientalis]